METFKALASPTRLEVLRALDQRRKTGTELANELGLNKATVHEHLNILAATGLVTRKDEGRKWVYWELSWSGRKLLHPNESTAFAVMLGLGLAAAGGSVIQAGRVLGWWWAHNRPQHAADEGAAGPFGPEAAGMVAEDDVAGRSGQGDLADAGSEDTTPPEPAASPPPSDPGAGDSPQDGSEPPPPEEGQDPDAGSEPQNEPPRDPESEPDSNPEAPSGGGQGAPADGGGSAADSGEDAGMVASTGSDQGDDTTSDLAHGSAGSEDASDAGGSSEVASSEGILGALDGDVLLAIMLVVTAAILLVLALRLRVNHRK